MTSKPRPPVTELDALVLWRAMFAYWGDEGLDTLHKIEKPAAVLMALLGNEANWRRLSSELGREKVEALLRSLDDVRSAAQRRHVAHKKSERNLAAAYSLLAQFWLSTHPGKRFTNVWLLLTDRSLMPKSDAACDIHEWMRLIDPHRPRLANELRELMRKTRKKLRGDPPAGAQKLK